MSTSQSMMASASRESQRELEFTGERIVPGKTVEALFREHEERYIFAGRYVTGKDVLDIACGTGVGTSFLRRAGARSILGLDIAEDAVAYAKARYPACEFAQGDAMNLCLPSESVDVVVSFETLEHIQEQEKFLIECWRVLRPGGTLICSTPNKTVYRWQGTNPFHFRELTLPRFVDLVSTYFSQVKVFSQSDQIYPFFVVWRLVSRALDRLNLKQTIKGLVKRDAAGGELPEEFCERDHILIHPTQLHRITWLKQPTYLIAVGQKVLPDSKGSNG